MAKKRPYETPQLIVYGNIQALTVAVAKGGTMDGLMGLKTA